MLPNSITIEAPSRLHFGMFSFKQPGVRQFGGVGLMLSEPAYVLRASQAKRFEAVGPGAERVALAARRLVQANWLPLPATDVIESLPTCRIEVCSSPRPHVGLGSGTQLALATAASLATLFETPAPSYPKAARITGRGERSAVGLLGFTRGGLIVEAGKQTSEEISPLAAHVHLPEAWRCLLLCPRDEMGKAGEAERTAFAQLPSVAPAVTARLAQMALLELVPAAILGDFDAFSEAAYAFGRLAGECFAPGQGGPYASPRLESLVARLRAIGVRGVGQSSWGPTLFAFVQDAPSAAGLASRLQRDGAFDGLEISLARPAQTGFLVQTG